MKLSICIPTYNRKEKVLRQISRIIPQLSNYDTTTVEVLVSDNCSKDGTSIAIKEQYAKDKLTLYTQNNNLGLVGNLYFLFEKAQGEYIWFLSDDDLVEDDAVSNILEALSCSSKDFYLLNFKLDTSPGSLYWQYDSDYLSLFNSKTWGGFGLLSAQVLRKQAFREFYYSTKADFNLCQPVAVSLYGLFYLKGEVLFDKAHLKHHVGDYSWAPRALEVSSVYLYYSIRLLKRYGEGRKYREILNQAVSTNIMAGASIRYILKSRDFRYMRDLKNDRILFSIIATGVHFYIKKKLNICLAK